MNQIEMNRQRAGTISDVMMYAFAAKNRKTIDLPIFLKLAFAKAKEIFPHENDFNSKKRDEINLIMALTHVAYVKYRKEVSLGKLGKQIALVLGRDRHYDHATILHKVKQHINALSISRGYQDYIDRYSILVERLREDKLI